MKVFNTVDGFNKYMQRGKPTYNKNLGDDEQPFDVIIRHIIHNNKPVWEILKVYYKRSSSIAIVNTLEYACIFGKAIEDELPYELMAFSD